MGLFEYTAKNLKIGERQWKSANINEINDKLGDIEKRLADLEQNKE